MSLPARFQSNAAFINYPKQAAFGRTLPKNKIYEHSGANTRLKDLFVEQVEQIVWQYKLAPETINLHAKPGVPVIQLGRATTKEAVCLVFEKVNTGGVPLNVFELVTATYAADGFNLRDDWHGNATRNVSGRYQRLCKEALLSQVESTDFLQAVSMLHTLELRRADVASGKTGKSVQRSECTGTS